MDVLVYTSTNNGVLTGTRYSSGCPGLRQRSRRDSELQQLPVIMNGSFEKFEIIIILTFCSKKLNRVSDKKFDENCAATVNSEKTFPRPAKFFYC